MSDDNLLASRTEGTSANDDEENIPADREQIAMMGNELYTAIMACIASTTATEFLVTSLASQLANGLPSGQTVNYATLNTPYWFEAFIRSTPQRSETLKMEHSINKYIKKKDSILFTL
jgi:hypothetical protein